MLFRVYSNTFLQKMCFFPHVIFLHWFVVPFSCLINVLFSLILIKSVFFSNACLILELLLCNRNLTKFNIRTLLSSNCRAWALKLNEHLNKWKQMFLSSFRQLQLKCHFSKIVCVWHSTSCMTGELWPTRFIWHRDIRVAHSQYSAMTFVFTQYFFYNSFRHGLISMCSSVRSTAAAFTFIWI